MVRDDGVVAAAIRAARYADAVMRRTASDADPARWPEDLNHHLNEPTGYSAGYAAYHHPDFAGDWHKAEEAFYVDAGGEGLKFEDGFEDAQNGLPHQLDQVSKRYKPLRDVADQLRQQQHNTLSEMGDLTVDEHGRPTRTEGPSVKHPSGSWEGCPSCSPKKGMGDSDYTDPDEKVDPFDPRLIGAGRKTADWKPEPSRENVEYHCKTCGEPLAEDYYNGGWFHYDQNGERSVEDVGHYPDVDYTVHNSKPENQVRHEMQHDWHPEQHPVPDWKDCPSCSPHGLSEPSYSDPDENLDPFDPRLIGASRTAGYGGEWHEELYDENGDYIGPPWPQDMAHHLHSDPVQAPYNAGYHAAWHPAFRDEKDRLGVAESAWHAAGGSPNSSDSSQDFASFEDGWMDSLNEIPHKFLDPQAHQAHLEGQLDEQKLWKERQHEKAIEKHFNPYPGWNPDEHQDPFDPRLLGASRRTAGEDVVLPHDEPHDDWRPRYGDNPKVQKWHPYVGGDTHAKYHIYSLGGGRNSVVWGANHHGIYQGMERVYSPLDGDHGSITMPSYSTEHEPEQLGRFRTPEQAKAAAEKHFADTYGRHQKMDGLNLDQMMRDHGDRPRAETGLGEDEDYGHIFGMLRQAGWEMADIIRLAGDGMSWEDTMRHIDQVLAQGEQTPVRKMRTAPEGFRPQPPRFFDDGEFDYLSDGAEARRIRDWDE